MILHHSKTIRSVVAIPTVYFRYGILNTVGILHFLLFYCMDYSNLFQYFSSMCYGPYSS